MPTVHHFTIIEYIVLCFLIMNYELVLFGKITYVAKKTVIITKMKIKQGVVKFRWCKNTTTIFFFFWSISNYYFINLIKGA